MKRGILLGFLFVIFISLLCSFISATSISSCAQLRQICTSYSAATGNYDITLDFSCAGYTTPICQETGVAGQNYEAFRGTLNGNNHTISGITIMGSGTDGYPVGGLVSKMNGATIKELGIKITKVYIEESGVGNNNCVGGFVGEIKGGLIKNCNVTQMVAGTTPSSSRVVGNKFVGGFVGTARKNSIIANSYADIWTIAGWSAEKIGGFVGGDSNANMDEEGGLIVNCSAHGVVSGINSIGGFVGYQHDGSGSIIRNSYSTGSVSVYCPSSGDIGCGGFAGRVKGYIYDSYSTGSISRYNSNGGYNMGGFVGYNYAGDIFNCYSTGSVGIVGSYPGGPVVGGFVGYNYGPSSYGVIKNSYSTGESSGNGFCGGANSYSDIDNSYWYNSKSSSGCYASDQVTKVSPASVFYPKTHNVYDTASPLWDFTNIWFEHAATYPTFRWDCLPSCVGKECGSDGCSGSCGTCTNAHGTTSCISYLCNPVCSGLWGNCDGNNVNGCETDLNTVSNCGSCGTTCTNAHGTTQCTSGNCIPTCSPGWDSCDGNAQNGCETQLGTNSNCASCGDVCSGGDICQGGTCTNPAELIWTNMKKEPLSDAQIRDTVLASYPTGLGEDIEIWEKTGINKLIRTITNTFTYNGGLFGKWIITQADFDLGGTTDADFYAKSASSSDESAKLEVANNTYGDYLLSSKLVKPVFGSNFTISDGQTSDISFEQIVSDTDDDLQVIWSFGDTNTQTISDCLTTSNCNTTHKYTSSGTKAIFMTTKEMTRQPQNKNCSRVFVYKGGYNIFSIIDSPDCRSPVNGPGKITLNGTSSNLKYCNFDLLTCQTRDGGHTCYQIAGATPNIYCYTFRNSVDLKFEWIIDGTVDSSAPTNNAPYEKTFVQPEEHTIALRVSYDESLP